MGIQGRGSACLLWLLRLAILMSLMMILMKQMCAEATQYTVGDSKKWNLNVDYSSWAATYSFKTGDTLLFSYNAEAHSVYQVSQADYGSCNNLDPIKMYSDGNTIIDLNEATTYYFMCGVFGHCGLGMKVVIKVEEASNSTPSISLPPPPTAPPPTKVSSVTPTNAPPPIGAPPPAKAPIKSTPAKSPTSPPLSTPTKPPTPSSTPSISPTLASSPSPLLSLPPSPIPPTSVEIQSLTPPIIVPGGSTSLHTIIILNILLGALSIMIHI